MTPKSLLRAPELASPLSEMGPGTSFHRLIHETDTIAPADKVRRVVLCSGKIYFDLLKARREHKIDDVAILRLEQIYPFPAQTFAQMMAPYRNCRTRLVPGGAGEHGRVVVHRPAHREGIGSGRREDEARALCRPARGGGDGDRPVAAPHCRAGARRRGGAATLTEGGSMATEIVVPTVGESVTEVTVARWLKKVGEAVSLDDPLVELETDKATQELAAQATGTLTEIVAPEGATIKVGGLLGRIGDGPVKSAPAKKPSPLEGEGRVGVPPRSNWRLISSRAPAPPRASSRPKPAST